ncbi:hypothetical protein [Alkalihalobacillus trypoxylicola]|uniref:Uncharacterized protein n=1 Tax=Alkalihalobacillus trypoxylicola TaxID=519424 RepID=A0A161QFP1_9BACI|nr:hypothetical protein [Alkalihalobacillus trypoxylicola]KYG27699.1 hypothetical protein AZF04_10950 [Alkalihalobacillus trypoxylicola]
MKLIKKYPKLFIIILIIIISLPLSAGINSMGETGQFIKFIFYNLLIFNFLAFILAFVALSIFPLIGYFIMKGKAPKPFKAIFLSIPLFLIFGYLSYALFGDGVHEIKDVFHYFNGHIMEETVVIDEVSKGSVTFKLRGPYETYKLSDNREFTLFTRGVLKDGASSGETYIIRYLPETETILSMQQSK